jgi:ribonuclease HI
MADRPHGRRQPRRKGRARSDGERRQLARAARHRGPPAPEPADRARLLCDGGSRGNPGPAAVAAVLLAPDGAVLHTRSSLIGRATAAEAEYRAILLGLELATDQGADPVEVCSDSRLAITGLVQQAPADAVLAALVREIRASARRFSAVRWRWHPRGDNEAADELVRLLLWP